MAGFGSEDYDKFLRLTKQLKQNAQSLNFTAIAQVASELESLVRQGITSNLDPLLIPNQ